MIPYAQVHRSTVLLRLVKSWFVLYRQFNYVDRVVESHTFNFGGHKSTLLKHCVINVFKHSIGVCCYMLCAEVIIQAINTHFPWLFLGGNKYESVEMCRGVCSRVQ